MTLTAAPTDHCADMRKALPRDVHKKSIKPLDRAVMPYELDDTL